MSPRDLEQHAYRSEYASGLLETFVGVGLLILGVGWLTGYLPIASVGPALLAMLWPAVRNRFLGPRMGRVKFRAERRRRERTGFIALVLLGFVTFGLATAVFLLQIRGSAPLQLGDVIGGLPGTLLAIGAVLAALMFGLPRIFGYAALFFLGAVCTVVFDLDPGWSLIGTGAVLVAAGGVLLAVFVRNQPVVPVD